MSEPEQPAQPLPWWKPNVQFTLGTTLLLLTAMSANLSALLSVSNNYRWQFMMSSVAATILLFRVGKWGLLTFVVGGAIGAWLGIYYKISWPVYDVNYPHCLSVYVVSGAAALLGVHGIFKKRFLLGPLAILIAYYSAVVIMGQAHGQFKWDW